MHDEHKTKDQLIAEITSLRQYVAKLEAENARHQQTRKALQENEARFRRFFESALVGMMFVDLDGSIIDANDAFLQMVGYTQIDLWSSDLNWHKLTPPEYAQRDQQAIEELKQNGVCAPFEKEFIRKDGSRIPIVLGGAILDETEQTTFAFVLDISQRRWAENALQAANHASQQYVAQLRGLMEAALTINAANSLNETLNIITEQARALIGAHQAITSVILDEERGQAVEVIAASNKHVDWHQSDEIPDQCGISTLVRSLTQPLHLTQTELTHHPLRRALSRRVSQHPPMRGLLAVPLIGKSGQNIGVIHVSDKCEGEFSSSDETVLVQLAQMAAIAIENTRLYQATQEANRIKDEFLSICSHELRTPLNSMLGWSRLLRSRKFDEATTARALETIERNAEAQAQLIEDLLDISRIITGKLRLNVRPVDLSVAVLGAIDTVYLAAEAKAIRIKTDIDSTLVPILGDPDRLQQVAWNLLSNAIKFTPRGGQVDVQLKRRNSQVEIVVSDTGQGIPADFLPNIFDRFRQADSTTTRQHGGLGLGLAIVRHLVELHGGSIWAKSPGVGKGATFTVSLPLTAVRIEQIEPVLTSAKRRDAEPFQCDVRLEGVRVLIVDDEEDARQFLSATLQQCGATVTTVASAQEALQIMAQEKPDVLLSDIGMPFEDGYTLIRRIRTLEHSGETRIPAAALTAYARPEDRASALMAGFQAHLSKPIEPMELIAVVASLTGRTHL